MSCSGLVYIDHMSYTHVAVPHNGKLRWDTYYQPSHSLQEICRLSAQYV